MGRVQGGNAFMCALRGFSEFLWPEQLDGVDGAALFTEATSYAGLGIEERGDEFVVYFSHSEGLERAAGYANFTADTVIIPDIGFGPV